MYDSIDLVLTNPPLGLNPDKFRRPIYHGPIVIAGYKAKKKLYQVVLDVRTGLILYCRNGKTYRRERIHDAIIDHYKLRSLIDG